MQWMTVQEKRGAAYDFSLGDEIYAWARAAGRAFWGHAIIDWTYLPEWLPGLVAEQSAGAAEALFKRHVQAMATHWRDKVFEQIVVNEAVTHVGMNPSIWFEKLGERYIDLAFHEAHKIEPTLPLMINEGSIEMDTRDQRARLDNYLGLIQRLRQRGVPFTAVGIQGHLKSDSPVNLKGLESFMKELATMGLSFMITELDVDDRGLPDDPRVRDAGVAAIMRDLLDLALEQPHCQGVNMWDLSDHDSWIVRDPRRRRWTGGGQRPTLLDASYKPKASWAVLVDCLERARGPAQGSRVLPAGVRSG
jgi:endo-1,4-beta-xylanase